MSVTHRAVAAEIWLRFLVGNGGFVRAAIAHSVTGGEVMHSHLAMGLGEPPRPLSMHNFGAPIRWREPPDYRKRRIRPGGASEPSSVRHPFPGRLPFDRGHRWLTPPANFRWPLRAINQSCATRYNYTFCGFAVSFITTK